MKNRILLSLAGLAVSLAGAAERPWMLMNEDCSHVFGWHLEKHPGKPVTRESVCEYCDPFFRGAITHYLVNPNGMCAWCPSKALGFIAEEHLAFKPCGCSSRDSHDRLMALMRRSYADGVDPFAVMIARAREKGVVPWLSMRMNDIHDVTSPDNCAMARFWMDHPELRNDPKAPRGPKAPEYGMTLGFNYAHEQVRKRHLDGLAELLSRYDVDGVELDFMRYFANFPKGTGLENCRHLTAFLREARKIADVEGGRKGRRLTLAVTIASRPEAARALGCDFETWAREGLVDVVIACGTIMTLDGGMSVKEWKRRLAAANPQVKFIAGTDVNIAGESWWGTVRGITLEEEAGWLERHLFDGTDGFYFFNYHYVGRDNPRARHIVSDGWTRERFAAEPRVYPVSCCAAAPTLELRDDQKVTPGERPVSIRVLCGGAASAAKVSVCLAFATEPRQATLDSVRLNGRRPLSVVDAPEDHFVEKKDAKWQQGKKVKTFSFPSDALVDDENVVTIGGDGKPDARIHACHIEVSPTDDAKVLETRTICREEGRYVGWPTLCRRANGELLVVYSGDRDAHCCPWGKVRLLRSTDDGRTWSAPETIADTILDDRDAGIVELRDGTLLVNWFTSIAYYEDSLYWIRHTDDESCRTRLQGYRKHFDGLPKDEREALLGNWTMRSADGGKTWEKAVRQTGTRPHNVIELRDGRLLAVGVSSPCGDSRSQVPICEESSDGGRSWRVLSRIPLGSDYLEKELHEPHAVELSDGRLIAHFRWQRPPKGGGTTPAGESLQTESADGGRTWTPLHSVGIHGYPPHLISLSDGRLLCAYTKRMPGCCGIYAVLSADGARTWDLRHEILLCPAETSDLGYPSSVQLPDGRILTVFYQAERAGEKPMVRQTLWTLPAQTDKGKDPAQERPWVVWNEDCTYFPVWIDAKYPGQKFTREMLQAFIDRFLGKPITHYSLNPCGMVAYYDSKVLECAVRRHAEMKGKCGLSVYPDHDRVMQRQHEMLEAGIDPWEVFLARVREKGVTPWLSMRMNDYHNVTLPTNCACSRFWREHPEFHRDPNEPMGPSNTNYGRGLSFDYRHAEVRQLHLKVIDELLGRYDGAEGIELDYMRHPMYFRRGHEAEDAHFLTDFMREARKIVDRHAKRKGRPITLAVRITTRPAAARAIGFDIETWAKEGLMDVLIACNDIRTTDFGLAVPEWRTCLEKVNPNMKIVVGTDLDCSPECGWNGRRGVKPEEHNGWIERHLADGADGLYYFNYFYGEPTSPNNRQFKCEDWTQEYFAGLPRDYPVGVCDASPTSETDGYQFGAVGEQPLVLKVRCGKRPTQGTVAVCLSFSDCPRESVVGSIRLNGTSATKADPCDPDSFTPVKERRKGNFAIRAEFPRTSLKDGENVVSILGDGKPNGRACACRIEVRP